MGRRSHASSGARNRRASGKVEAAAGRAPSPYSAALERHRAGDLDRAERGYRKVLARDPEHAGALHHLGLLARTRGHRERAMELVSRAHRSAPHDVHLCNNLGNLYAETGRWVDAANHYRAALELDPAYASARYNLGKALLNLGDADAALECFLPLVDRFPDDAQIRSSLGAALLDLGQVEEAVVALEHAVESGPNLASTHHDLGLAYLDKGRFEAAIACFRRALSLDPRMTKAWRNLAKARRFDHEDDTDIAGMRQVLEPADPLPGEARMEVHFALGKALDDCGAFESAFAHYRAANALKRRQVEFDPARAAHEVDEQIATFDRDRFARYRNLGIDSGRPVFVVGMARSGTSLVEQILASHPRAAGAGELPHIARLAAALGPRLGCRDPYPQCVAALSPETAREVAGEYLRALVARGGDESAARIVDKTPGNYLDLGLIALLFPHARVVHCRRNPLDVCLSLYFQHFTAGHAYAYDWRDIAAQFRAYQRLMAHWRRVLPLAVHEVEYERLVMEPEAVTRALVAFCGLPWDGRCLDFHATERAVHTASAWQVRQPIYRRSVARWRHYESHVGPLRSALGDLVDDGSLDPPPSNGGV